MLTYLPRKHGAWKSIQPEFPACRQAGVPPWHFYFHLHENHRKGIRRVNNKFNLSFPIQKSLSCLINLAEAVLAIRQTQEI